MVHRIMAPDEVAASCYRAFCAAAGVREAAPSPFEHLSLEGQAPWLKVALRGEAVLVGCEGKRYAEAAAALAALQAGGDVALLEAALAVPGARVAYEALARHLMALCDGEGHDDLGMLEDSWGPWAQARAVRSQGSGVRNQGSGVRGQESGVRSQESGVRATEETGSLLTPDS